MRELALVRDFRDEGWPSMDLCADQLTAHLSVADISPSFVRIASQFTSHKIAFNADRLFNRYVRLPFHLRSIRDQFSCYHIVDHSYAHLVHSLPADRTGVYCHDLDAFRCVLQPETEYRPWWFRKLAIRILTGLGKAAIVFHNSQDVARQLLLANIIQKNRLLHVPLGVAQEFTPNPDSITDVTPLAKGPFLLHVGSNIPRKRLDVLLEVFARVRQTGIEIQLVQVGGPWPAPLKQMITRLGIDNHTVQVRNLSRSQLAALYRQALVVLVTSEAEGFGLPVIEALACGAKVIASDIPTLREAGGTAALYCPVGKVDEWTKCVCRILKEDDLVPSQPTRLAWASQFSWKVHAEMIANAYRKLLT